MRCDLSDSNHHRQGGQSSKTSTPTTFSESTNSLLYNCRDRLESFDILIDNSKYLKSLECAHLGLEIALKLILKHKKIAYPREHSLAKLSKLILDKVVVNSPSDKNLRQVAASLNSTLLEPDSELKSWNTSYRYALTEATQEHISFANSCCETAKKVLEYYEQEQHRSHNS